MKKLLIVLVLMSSLAILVPSAYGDGLKECLREFETTVGDMSENDEFMDHCLSKGFKVDSEANLGVCYINWVNECLERGKK